MARTKKTGKKPMSQSSQDTLRNIGNSPTDADSPNQFCILGEDNSPQRIAPSTRASPTHPVSPDQDKSKQFTQQRFAIGNRTRNGQRTVNKAKTR